MNEIYKVDKDSSNQSPDNKKMLREGEKLYNQLLKLNRDVSTLKKHGSPQLIDIQTFAERTLTINLEYENYITKLIHERQTVCTINIIS